MQVFPRQVLIGVAAAGMLAVTSACGGQDGRQTAADSVAATRTPVGNVADASESTSPSASASRSVDPSASDRASVPASASPSGAPLRTGSARSGETAASDGRTDSAPVAPAAPDFPVAAEVGDATQLITVKASGSYATVTAWARDPPAGKRSSAPARAGSARTA